jgi:hypothetical protein
MTTTEKDNQMKDFSCNSLKKIKAVQDLNKHPVEEVTNWVIEAIDFQYPIEHKKAYEVVTKMNWNDIRADIIQTAKSQDYDKIHALTEGMLKADLLTTEVIKNMKKPRDLGNLAVFYDKPNIRLLLCFSMLNKDAKDPKIETYILYRYLCGKPRLSNGILSKF